jgi:nucleotidyltransferase/DNA polymerase involved in DNA repair
MAKLATRMAKPAGFFEVPEGGEEEFLSGLDISALPGIGPKAQVVLRMLNVQRIGDLGLPRPTPALLFGWAARRSTFQAAASTPGPSPAEGLKSVSRRRPSSRTSGTSACSPIWPTSATA